MSNRLINMAIRQSTVRDWIINYLYCKKREQPY